MRAAPVLSDAIADLRSGFEKAWIWDALARLDIRQRYIRSKLGPLWLTLNVILTTAAFALLFKDVLGKGDHPYLAYVALGQTVWQFIQAVVVEACLLLVISSEVLRNAALPLSIHFFRLVWRNLLIFINNLVVVMAILTALGQQVLPHWTVIPALALCSVMAFALGLMLGIPSARFRDLAPSITSLMLLLFFVTPVFWYPGQLLGNWSGWLRLNPAVPFIDIVRMPLLGEPASAASWGMAIGLTICSLAAGLTLFAVFRRRVVFWL